MKMKRQIVGIIIFLTCFSVANAQQQFTINGKVNGLKENSKLMLEYRNGSNRVKDSALVNGGKFSFKGKVDQPVKATLTVSVDGPMTMEKMMAMDVVDFYLEKGKITISGTKNLKSALVKGGKTQGEYLALQAELKKYNDEMAPLQEKITKFYTEKNETAASALFPQLRAIRVEMNKVEDNFIYQHPDSYVSFDMVKEKAIVIDAKTFEPFFNALSERLRNTDEGKSIKERLAIAKRTAVGQPAMDFTQKDVDGKPVTLSSLKGKYILLDFWASWCGPCRAENPNVLKAYNKFKDKNFDVLAVSLDENRDAWLKAIKDDGMPWIQVSDLKGFDNEAAVQYGIKAIPQNFLIAPDGKIVASNLRGEALDKELSEILGDK